MEPTADVFVEAHIRGGALAAVDAERIFDAAVASSFNTRAQRMPTVALFEAALGKGRR